MTYFHEYCNENWLPFQNLYIKKKKSFHWWGYKQFNIKIRIIDIFFQINHNMITAKKNKTFFFFYRTGHSSIWFKFKLIRKNNHIIVSHWKIMRTTPPAPSSKVTKWSFLFHKIKYMQYFETYARTIFWFLLIFSFNKVCILNFDKKFSFSTISFKLESAYVSEYSKIM